MIILKYLFFESRLGFSYFSGIVQCVKGQEWSSKALKSSFSHKQYKKPNSTLCIAPVRPWDHSRWSHSHK